MYTKQKPFNENCDSDKLYRIPAPVCLYCELYTDERLKFLTITALFIRPYRIEAFIPKKKFWEELIRLLSCHVFEVLEPNLMEINLSELTLTSFNSS
jgi:hypothetical protein